MKITFAGKLTNWEEIKQTIFEAVGLSDYERVQDLENAIRRAGVEKVNKVLANAGHEAQIQL